MIWITYWRLGLSGQNWLLLIGSYIFYAFWDWRFLSLIWLSTIVDFIVGQQVFKWRDVNRQKARRWLLLSLTANLGLLAVFKYFGFFADGFADLLGLFGLDAGYVTLNILLPVGISFYTFQTLSYTVDIYRGQLNPTSKLRNFALFVGFFPQLVAGPIERAKNLLPQIERPRQFDLEQLRRGLFLMFWGLFKKVYVADNIGPHVDAVFSDPNPSGLSVAVGVWLFAFQIYADFSGYTDIARGCAKCLGMDLRLNFNFPYISTDPSEFWQRWHISLSSWLRDYLYIPLGGNRGGSFNTYRNLSITMLLGGLWHGAAWNFVLWGAYQGLLLIGHRLLNVVVPAKPGGSNGFVRLLKMACFFQLVCFGWLLFRAVSGTQIADFSSALFSWRAGSFDPALGNALVLFVLPLISVEFISQMLKRYQTHIPQTVLTIGLAVLYALPFYLLTFYGASAQSFIYFQF